MATTRRPRGTPECRHPVRAWNGVGIAMAVAVVLLGTACGYRLVRFDDSLGGVRRVAVETLRNDSYEPGLGALVTDALAREFVRHGGVRLTQDPDAADLFISGSVLPLDPNVSSVSSTSLVLEYELELRLELEARRRDGTLLLLPPGLTRAWELYLTSPDIEAARKNRGEALRRLADVLAQRVHESLAEQLRQ